MSEENNGSMISGFFWMTIVSILLVWLPTFGPLIAGIVGGKKAGGVGKGFLVSLLPAVLLGILSFFAAASLAAIPLLGTIAAMGSMVFVLAMSGPLIIGAIIGGLLA